MRAGNHWSDTERGEDMLAALGMGLIGTIVVVIVVIAVIMFFVRRA
jgi:hypothetical protein